MAEDQPPNSMILAMAFAFAMIVKSQGSNERPDRDDDLEFPTSRPWNVKQVAKYLGLSEYTVYCGAAGTRDIPRIKMGRSVRWDPNDVIAWHKERHAWSKKRIDRRLGKLRTG